MMPHAARRPFLLIDIDGVLNPWGVDAVPAGYAAHHLFGAGKEPILLAEQHGEWLRELGAAFELVWASAWGPEANRLLSPIFGLGDLASVPMPPPPFHASDKVPAVAAYVGDRPAAWMDDLLTPEAHRWASGRGVPTLLVDIDHTTGLTRADVDQLLGWAAAL